MKLHRNLGKACREAAWACSRSSCARDREPVVPGLAPVVKGDFDQSLQDFVHFSVPQCHVNSQGIK